MSHGSTCRVAGLAMALVLATSGLRAQVETPVPGDPVTIDSGLVSGKVLGSGVRAYLGIPYAAPPVRENRWRDPQPVAPWKGVYHADRKPPMCMQNMRAHDLNHYFGEEAASEDCLYLNLWAPNATRPGERRPVLVFIYGGGFTQGTANLANYSGESLARKGVVYVAMNYRVGVFGFMAHPAVSAENGRKTSGNWGLLDQVAALQWVRRNIARFGGDPDNVTILGQSAGSASVSYLQSSPLARGLIHRVFGMSGCAIVNAGAGRTSTLPEAEAAGVQFQQQLKAASLAAMRQLPADVLYQAQRVQGAPRFQPVVDRYLLPEMPNEIFARGQQNDVPTLLGYMRDESTNALRTSATVLEYQAAAKKLFGDAATQFLALYPAETDAQVKVVGAKAARESGIAFTMWTWAQAQTKTGKAPVFINEFSRVHPYAPGITFSDHDPATVGAYHTGEVPYWLQTQDAYNLFRTTRNWTPYDRDLASKMSDALIAFAKTGSPRTAALDWPKYDPANEQQMEFGDAVTTGKLNSAGLRFFLQHPASAMPASRDR